MERITVSVEENQLGRIDELAGDSGPHESRSEAVRAALRSYEEVEDLRRTVERLENEKRTLLAQREEHAELVEYVEAERSIQQRREERERVREAAPAWRRAKWWLFGRESPAES